MENICGRPHVVNHLSVPAACFTHPEVSFVGVTQERAEELAKEQGFKLGVSKTSFKGNSKVGGGVGRAGERETGVARVGTWVGKGPRLAGWEEARGWAGRGLGYDGDGLGGVGLLPFPRSLYPGAPLP